MTTLPPQTTDQPWRAVGKKVLFGLSALAGLMILFASSSNGFVPTPLGDLIAAGVALAVAASVGVWTALDPSLAKGSPKLQALETKSSPMAIMPLRAGLLAAFMFLGVFIATERGFLRLWNAAVGVHGDLTVTESGYTRGGYRSGCEGFKVQEAPWLMNAAVCANYRYNQEPPRGTLIDLYGRRSPVGIDVNDFRVRPWTPITP
jgi:hypothetical protein